MLLASPRLVERVNFARALAEKAHSVLSPEAEEWIEREVSVSSPMAKPKPLWWGGFIAHQPPWGMAMAACAIFVLVGGIALFSGWSRLRSESERLSSEQAALQRQKEELDKLSVEQRTRTEQLSAELQRERDQRAEDLKLIEELQRANKLKETQPQQSILTRFATVLLTPGSLRSGGRQSVLPLGPATTTARVQVALQKNDYPKYNAEIKTPDGSVVFHKDGLKPHLTGSGPQLLLYVPTRSLSPNDYLVHVDGVTAAGQVESVDDYALPVRIEK
jgi:hypothetical protein